MKLLLASEEHITIKMQAREPNSKGVSRGTTFSLQRLPGWTLEGVQDALNGHIAKLFYSPLDRVLPVTITIDSTSPDKISYSVRVPFETLQDFKNYLIKSIKENQ